MRGMLERPGFRAREGQRLAVSHHVVNTTDTLAQCLRVAAFAVFASACPLAFRSLTDRNLARIEKRMDEALSHVLKNAPESENTTARRVVDRAGSRTTGRRDRGGKDGT